MPDGEWDELRLHIKCESVDGADKLKCWIEPHTGCGLIKSGSTTWSEQASYFTITSTYTYNTYLYVPYESGKIFGECRMSLAYVSEILSSASDLSMQASTAWYLSGDTSTPMRELYYIISLQKLYEYYYAKLATDESKYNNEFIFTLYYYVFDNELFKE